MELQKFFSWTTANKLSINFGKDKTYFILHSYKKRNLDDLSIQINGNILENLEKGLFLGVMIDKKLKYDSHVDYIASKIAKSIGIIYHLKSLKMPFCVLKQVYYSLIYSYINYNICCYGSTYATHTNRLYLLQKRAIRIINNAPFLAHTEPLFYSNGILKFDDIFKLNVGLYMYDHRLSGQYNRGHGYNTRNRNELLPNSARLTVCEYTMSVVGPNTWNNIPTEIQQSHSRNSFKYNYKKYLLSFYAEQA